MPLKFQADCVGQGSGLRYSLWESWLQDGGLLTGGLWEEPSASCLWSGKQAEPVPIPVEMGVLCTVVPNWADDQALGMGCSQKGGSYHQERVIAGGETNLRAIILSALGERALPSWREGTQGPSTHPTWQHDHTCRMTVTVCTAGQRKRASRRK